ncbi:hypothetical protein CVT25_009439 [Psilocybe cyanescens]|uniref:Uncharacterized protein n=1 Tax=Psilocybe cyanescens TaxID=93625 RepID=A0A409XVB4_PSICY|nr:hypothetical protein CVT25_009439 [Psilocybe cyanescens]
MSMGLRRMFKRKTTPRVVSPQLDGSPLYINDPSPQVNDPPQVDGPPLQVNVSPQVDGPLPEVNIPPQVDDPPPQVNDPPPHVDVPPLQVDGPPPQANIPLQVDGSLSIIAGIPQGFASHDEPKNILAFRTITQMLFNLSTSNGHQQNKSEAIPQSKNAELLVCNAVATLSVMDREVVAVVAHHGPSAVQVTVALQNDRPNHFSSVNACGDNDKTYQNNASFPIIETVTPTTTRSDEWIKDAVLTNRAVMDDRLPTEDFSDRLFMISRLVNMVDDDDGGIHDRLGLYIIGACHQMMVRRLQNHVSKHYKKTLSKIEPEAIQFDKAKVVNPSNSQSKKDKLFMDGDLPYLLCVPEIIKRRLKGGDKSGKPQGHMRSIPYHVHRHSGGV